MREMKDSGIPSIKEIPVDWATCRLKFVLSGLTDGTHGTYERVSEGFPLLSAKNVFDDGIHIGDSESLVSEKDYRSIISNGFPKKGDVLLCCVGTVGRCTVYQESKPIAFQRSVIFMRPDSVITSEYLKYAMQSDSTLSQESLLINQAAQAGLYQGSVKEIIIPIPSIHEQNAIVEHLHNSDIQINNSITRHKAIIEKLQEYRKAVITQAVTKGLDPDVKMKDSGIPGIGQIANNYEELRIKFLGSYRNGLTYSPRDVVEEGQGVLVLRSSNIQNDKLSFEDNVFVACEVPETLMVKPGDILICARNGSAKLVGKSALIDSELNATYGAFMMVFRPYSANSKYLYYLFNSNVFNSYRASFATTTVNQITAGILGDMTIPYCKNEQEQSSIAIYLDEKCSQINEAITRQEQAIKKLEEYRKSVIYNAITGKIDCRKDA